MGHRHGPGAAPARERGRGPLTAVAGLVVALTVLGLLLLRPTGTGAAETPDRGERTQGTITAVALGPCSEAFPGLEPLPGEPVSQCQTVTVRLDDGPDTGRVVEQVDGLDAPGVFEAGRGVVLISSGAEVPFEERYQLVDVQRGGPLLLLAALFVAAVLALGRWRGALALVGLGLSAVLVVAWLVPALLDGGPSVLTAVVGASAVMVVALGLTHGPGLRTVVALLGTATSLLLVVALSTVFVELAGLTGLTSDEATFVRAFFGDVDLRGLLLAGIVVGALGILDDVTVTQVSAVCELRAADPEMPGRALYRAALRVGRDHIASTVNTLLLAYAGASLPLLVIFTTSGDGVVDTLTSGVLAQEVVRTLAGSIGLVAAVPVTTALAAYAFPPSPSRVPGSRGA